MNNVRDNLKAYLDGELSPMQMREVESAVERDGELRREFEEMKQISSTLRTASVAPTVVGLDKTLAALKKPVRPPLLRFAPAAALVGTCALALIAVGHFMRPQPAFNDEIPLAMEKNPALVHRSRASTDSNRQAAIAGVMAGGEHDDTVPVQISPKAEVNSRSLDVAAERKGQPVDALNPVRQIVKTGELTVLVPRANQALDSVNAIAKKLGGLVESSNLSGDEMDGRSASVSLRVPVAKFDEAMQDLRKLGKVSGESTDGRDVTTEVVDSDARLKVMRAAEQSYIQILNKARKQEDVLSVHDRLDTVRQDIEGLTAQLKSLRNQAAMSTISVTITQKAAPKVAGVVKDNWIDKTWAGAWSGLGFAGRKLTEALIYLVVFSPVWIPIFIVAGMLGRKARQLA
ncbi:MAG: hypothetical protein QOJ65_697 [Fimbriimonadaceae bacterium]|jgi:anti-sigma factor RsiW|nr:hypothetical protein [Fimbriimonadaceae bacterium]